MAQRHISLSVSHSRHDETRQVTSALAPSLMEERGIVVLLLNLYEALSHGVQETPRDVNSEHMY
jgi:hypothetical protein